MCTFHTHIRIRRHFHIRCYQPSYRRTHHHQVRHTPSARHTSHQLPRPGIQGKDSPLIRHLTFIYLTYPLRLHETFADQRRFSILVYFFFLSLFLYSSLLFLFLTIPWTRRNISKRFSLFYIAGSRFPVSILGSIVSILYLKVILLNTTNRNAYNPPVNFEIRAIK